MPGFPVHHQLPELTQTHVRRVGPTILSSVIPFSSCLQSFPASGSFPVSQFFTSGGQSIGVSASASVLPMNIPGWLPGECNQSPVNQPLCPEWWRSQYTGWKVQTFYSDIITRITWKWGRVILRIRTGEIKKKSCEARIVDQAVLSYTNKEEYRSKVLPIQSKADGLYQL